MLSTPYTEAKVHIAIRRHAMAVRSASAALRSSRYWLEPRDQLRTAGWRRLKPGVECVLTVRGRVLRRIEVVRSPHLAGLFELLAQFQVAELVSSAHRALGVKQVARVNQP